MAPRRAKKAAAAAIAQTVADSTDDAPNDNEQINVKPVKEESKKKTTKNSKKIEQNEENTNDNVVVAADAKTKSKKAPAKKNAKQMESTEENGKIDTADKAEVKPKKASAKKNVKSTEQTEQNGGNDETVKPVNTDAKSKKAPTKKNTKAVEVAPEEEEENGVANESPEKGKKRKAKPEEPKIESKAAKGKPKKVEEKAVEEAKNEAGPSKTEKKSSKSKSAKKVDDKKDAVEEVLEPPKKRGAKKIQSPEKQPVESKKPARGKAKQAETAKTQKQASDEIDNEHEVDDSAKGRKRKPAKSATSPAKKQKTEIASTSAAVADEPPKANGAPKKRKADSTTTPADTELVTKRKKSPKDEVKKEPKAKMNATATDFSKMNFDIDKDFNLKIVSWNVAGLRALIAKDGFNYFEHEKPDIICLQEIKCVEEGVPEEAKLKGYHPYWCSTAGGRGGVAILSKSMPYNVEKNIGDEEMDEEGRIITADYSKFYLVCVYVPNAGRGLVNLDRRLRWNKMFEEHVTKLKEQKPVIICGDMNVAHEEIDLANPKTNKKNAGFSKEEREGMTDLLELGFVDTFRDLHPDEEKAYTFWTYMANARAKNVGWRLDYSIVSENLKPKVVDSFMRPQILGSDHCPIVLLMNI